MKRYSGRASVLIWQVNGMQLEFEETDESQDGLRTGDFDLFFGGFIPEM